MNNKGFTLIEVLAVMVILGIVLMISVPNVSQYITRSRRSSYITDAKRYVEAARGEVETERMKITSKNTCYYIPRECIPVNKGQQSPFGDWKGLYVVVTYDGKAHDYYFTSTDTTGIGINLTYVENLSELKLVKNKKAVLTDVCVGDRTSIKVIGSDCSIKSATSASTSTSNNIAERS